MRQVWHASYLFRSPPVSWLFLYTSHLPAFSHPASIPDSHQNPHNQFPRSITMTYGPEADMTGTSSTTGLPDRADEEEATRPTPPPQGPTRDSLRIEALDRRRDMVHGGNLSRAQDTSNRARSNVQLLYDWTDEQDRLVSEEVDRRNQRHLNNERQRLANIRPPPAQDAGSRARHALLLQSQQPWHIPQRPSFIPVQYPPPDSFLIDYQREQIRSYSRSISSLRQGLTEAREELARSIEANKRLRVIIQRQLSQLRGLTGGQSGPSQRVQAQHGDKTTTPTGPTEAKDDQVMEDVRGLVGRLGQWNLNG